MTQINFASSRPHNIDQQTTSPYLFHINGPTYESVGGGYEQKKTEPVMKKRRFLDWMLRFTKSGSSGVGSGEGVVGASMTGSTSTAGSGVSSAYSIGSISPRTPDSSRSVSFDEAVNWPFIDDDVLEGGGGEERGFYSLFGGGYRFQGCRECHHYTPRGH